MLAARNRLLASPAFQRWAADTPLVRGMAQRHTKQLFDLCAGFVHSQVLHAVVKLDLLERLAELPRSAEDLAPELRLPIDATERLLGAAAALGLLAKGRDGAFGLGLSGAALRGNPAVVAMIAHHALLYDDLRDPLKLLREGSSSSSLSGYWPYAESAAPAELNGPTVDDYTRLMAQSQALIAQDILDAYNFKAHRTLLDVGGGSGAFVAAAHASAPNLTLSLFDLPAVAEVARRTLDGQGIGAKVAVVGGSFKTDRLPEGADVVTLIRILFDHDDATALAILRATRRCIAPGGTLIIAEPLAGTPGAETVTDAYYPIYLLAMGKGRVRSAAEFDRLAREAGYRGTRRIRTRRPLLTGIVAAFAGAP